MCNNYCPETSACRMGVVLVAPPISTRLQRKSIRSGRGCVRVLNCSGVSGSRTEQVSSTSRITPQLLHLLSAAAVCVPSCQDRRT
ncbi:hypothetical protein GDO81_027938 [Engystomops pustulosus]|uniref:Uncharacterized protein n=1 Tax=Engystomops pustulosus TaxID=76066 RepID=A0AAV6YNW6_ENGPU|nr:hypothetical protein GDO81_027938 [Engystomops pustulosus]